MFRYAQAQELKFKKNVFAINQAKISLYDKKLVSYQPSVWNLTTFSYERLIIPQLSISAAYGTWFFFRSRPVHGYITYRVPDLTIYPGSYLWNRYNYSYSDIWVNYRLFEQKRFKLTAGIGPSYTWGTNRMLDRVWVNPEPPSDVLFFTSKYKKGYFGMLLNMNYSYRFWKERIKAGVFTTGRYYPGLQSKQLDIGLQLGFCF